MITCTASKDGGHISVGEPIILTDVLEERGPGVAVLHCQFGKWVMFYRGEGTILYQGNGPCILPLCNIVRMTVFLELGRKPQV